MPRLAALLVLLLLVPAASARAGSAPGVDFELGFTTPEPGSPSGLTIAMRFTNPQDPQTAPSPQRSVVLELPDGSRLDLRAVPVCEASDAELMLRGPAACPPETQLGTGSLTFRTDGGPLLDPFVADARVFNGGDALVEVFGPRGTTLTTAVGRRRQTGPTQLSETLAPTPGGPPDGESSITELTLALPARTGAGGAALLRTPATCPGAWTSRLEVVTADGRTTGVTDTTPCVAPAGASTPSAGSSTPSVGGVRSGTRNARVRLTRRVFSGGRLRLGCTVTGADKRSCVVRLYVRRGKKLALVKKVPFSSRTPTRTVRLRKRRNLLLRATAATTAGKTLRSKRTLRYTKRSKG